jgi:hypothetical protein
LSKRTLLFLAAFLVLAGTLWYAIEVKAYSACWELGRAHMILTFAVGAGFCGSWLVDGDKENRA